MTVEKSIILQIALPVPLRRYFDYLPPIDCDIKTLTPGVRVTVPFQRRELIGFFMGLAETTLPLLRLKRALEILDQEPILSADLLQLSLWAADYYHDSIGNVMMNVLPTLLRQGKQPIVGKRSNGLLNGLLKNHLSEENLILNNAQKQAIEAIQMALDRFQVFLLEGVTGSGKTEVYLQVIQSFLNHNQSILVLVPEIGLTPQTIQRFYARFSVPLVLLHSGLTERARLNGWIAAKSGHAKIIIGTRSAIFTPCQNLGLIIIDEEHDLSFKQQEGFRYHARDIAIMRAHFNKIPIILGTATPSLETLHKANINKFQKLCLPMRAGKASLPEFNIIDIRNQTLDQGLSQSLLKEITIHLARNEQVMLFLNRRGFAPVLMCHACGYVAICKRCDKRMTYHHQLERLHCHHCDAQKKVPKQCEACREILHFLGMGTERLEMVLAKYFPAHSIVRIDRDNTKQKGSIEKLLAQIQSGEHQILIGTQMLAKGHHFPNVTLVGIVDMDGGLFSHDFRGLERMAQLLLQVSGRAGRMEKPGKVFIQTHHPDHPLLQQLFSGSYQQFADSLLCERKESGLPPFAYLALFRAEAYQMQHASDFLNQVKNLMQPCASLHILGPIPAPMPRRAGRYRMQLLLQAEERKTLQKLLTDTMPLIEKIKSKSRVRWSLDVDPLEMF